jgi:small-conductance mechanosensitive channel
MDLISALGEYGVTLRVTGTVRAAEQWAVAGELRKRLLTAFEEAGIQMPRTQRVVITQEAAGKPGRTPKS